MRTQIRHLLTRCKGLRISDAWRGEHAAIFLELGRLHRHSDKRPHASKGQGEVTVMLDCKWRLEKGPLIIAGSLNDYAHIDRALKTLVGRSIKGVTFLGRIPELVVELSGNHFLVSFSDYEAEDWAILFRQHGSISRNRDKVVFQQAATGVPPNNAL